MRYADRKDCTVTLSSRLSLFSKLKLLTQLFIACSTGAWVGGGLASYPGSWWAGKEPESLSTRLVGDLYNSLV